MRHALFGTDTCSASVAILIKDRGFNSDQIQKNYITPIDANPKAFIAFSLWYNEHNKCPAKVAREYLTELCAELVTLGIKTLLVADGAYFKFLSGKSKLDFYGYALDSKLKGFENEFKVILIPNYQALSYNPDLQTKIDLCLLTLTKYIKGDYEDPGTDIIKVARYPETPAESANAFVDLLEYTDLVVDIEATSLEFWNCGIATIAFAYGPNEFISFTVDRGPHAKIMKSMLRQFFIEYSDIGKMTGHNLSYDFKVLVYELWMNHLQDYEGMIQGIQILTKNFDDTKIITYLATNNAVENVLKLKVLSAEFAGNYAQADIKDTTKIPLPELLEYNGVDTISTWYVRDKYEPIMDRDGQRQIYDEIFKPSLITLLQTELCGMPIIPERVQEAKKKLTALVNGYNKVLTDSHIIQEFHLGQQEALMHAETANAVKKVFTMDDPKIVRFEFNPNSGTQLRKLIYDYMDYEIIDLTDTKMAATGGKTITKLLNHAKTQEDEDIFKALIGLADAGKILSDFIPAFENAVQLPDGSWRLYGNFNLGGTVSGRLSSSGPNLQNLPSHSVYAKLIKACFATIFGWLFSGADFNSLEDMVSALTTRDKNKMAVYIDGYCGHCLRAFFYFGSELPDIELTPESINSIKKLYPDYRQRSKSPTFLLTYGGTYHGLMKNLGLEKDEAIQIENQYHNLYSESDEWVASRIHQAIKDGYVIGAFGLKLRTPLLAKVKDPDKVPYKAQAEGRTAGNMLGQSYGMLNSRAMNEFRERVWASKYRVMILPAAQIHDAGYFVHKDEIGLTTWMNQNLIECMQWCELNELKHDIVKLGAELDIFYPNWCHGITIPNNAKKASIVLLCDRAVYGNHIYLWRCNNAQ